MADYGFIANAPQTNPMTAVKDILGFVQGAQALQQGNINLQRSTATLPYDIERSKAESSRAQTEATGAAQKLPIEIKTLQAQSETARTGADSASLALRTRNEDLARNTVAALTTNPAFISGGPEARHHILDSTEKYLNAQGLPTTPGGAVDQTRKLIDEGINGDAMRQHMAQFIQQGAAPAEKAGALNAVPGAVNNGQQTQFVGTNPYNAANAPIPPVQMQLPPGSVETTEIGPDKNTYIVTRGANGTILNTRPLAGGSGGGTGGGAGMPQFAPGDAEAIPTLEGERTAARNMLSSAPIAHATNQGILNEIDKVSTGTVGPTLQSLFSTLGVATGTAEQRASSYDLVGKYLERNAIEAAKSMGPHTNAGLESAIKANGSTSYNPTAIKKLTKLNDAIISGAEMYQPGLEKAIAAAGNRGVLGKREFDQAWAQNFDPHITMLDNAIKAKDTATIAEIRKQVGPKGMEELHRKALNLDRLTQDGRL